MNTPSNPAQAARAHHVPWHWAIALFMSSALSAVTGGWGHARAATLDASYGNTCAVSSSGGVKCWGSNTHFQLGDGTDVDSPLAVDVLGLPERATAVATGGNHNCALTESGGVLCWGYNGWGQLGNGSTVDSPVPVSVIGLDSGVTAIAAGLRHTCALLDAGGVKCWGHNGDGQLGDGTGLDSSTPVAVAGLPSGVAHIDAGWFGMCALTVDGAALCWGDNEYGRVGDGTTEDRFAPVMVTGLDAGVLAIATDSFHSCAVTAGRALECWGDNSYGQFGNGTYDASLTPTPATTFAAPVASVVTGEGNTCSLSMAGRVQCSGNGDFGHLGDGSWHGSNAGAVQVSGLGAGVVQLAGGYRHTCAQLEDSSLRCWGEGDRDQLGNGVPVIRTSPVDVVGLGAAQQMGIGLWHTCGLSAASPATCWGYNFYGQLGDGTVIPHTLPAPVQDMQPGALAIVAGQSHSCAITADGTVRCWGYNSVGQLGIGSLGGFFSSPVAPDLGAPTAMLSAGTDHTCAVSDGGGAKCWGLNNAGQLGDGTTVYWAVPVGVSGLSAGVSGIAAGGEHSCAVMDTGHVKCWGSNYSGQLGDGTFNGSLVPVDVPGLSEVVQIAAGNASTCALDQRGVVTCWGNDQVGLHEVQGIGGATAIAMGSGHACALTTAGGIRCWGDNDFGQLGDGTGISSPDHPVDVVGLTSGVASVYAGDHATCAITDEGVAKYWGDNALGQLGNGEIGYATIPQDVVGSPFGEQIFADGFD